MLIIIIGIILSVFLTLISKKDWIELLLFYELCQHNNLGGHIGRTSVLIRARKNCKSPNYTW